MKQEMKQGDSVLFVPLLLYFFFYSFLISFYAYVDYFACVYVYVEFVFVGAGFVFYFPYPAASFKIHHRAAVTSGGCYDVCP